MKNSLFLTRGSFTTRGFLAFVAVLALAVLALGGPALAQNSPPIADAGPDQSIYLGEITVLQGSASDPDGDLISSWSWTIESAPRQE